MHKHESFFSSSFQQHLTAGCVRVKEKKENFVCGTLDGKPEEPLEFIATIQLSKANEEICYFSFSFASYLK